MKKLSERITPGPWKLNERKDRLIGSNNEQVGFWALYAYSPVTSPSESEIANTICMQNSAEMLSIIEKLSTSTTVDSWIKCKYQAIELLQKLNS